MNTMTTTRLSMLGRYCILIGILAVRPGLTQGSATGYMGSDQAQLPVVDETAALDQSDGAAIEYEPESVQELDLPPGVSGGWWGAVQEDIHQSEYSLTWQDHTYLRDIDAAYQAPNRAHGLRTYFTPEGIRIIPRTGKEPAWELGLDLTSYSTVGALQIVEEPELVVQRNHAEYRRGALTEWYLNDERGLEQGFTLNVSPEPGKKSTGGWIVLRMALYGNLKASLEDTASAIEFTTSGGVRVLRYDQLQACDANGKELGAKFALADEGIEILVDTRGAVYPISIDPLATSPSWSAESDKAYSYFGESVGTAGDVNGDGYDEVIVGAYWYDNGQSGEGRAFVYHGGAAGLSTNPIWTAESNQVSARFGYSVGTAGDVDGDGFDDIVVGAPNYTNTYVEEGRAYIYHGSSSGLSSSPDWTAESVQTEAYFGISVATAGDVNDDGFADVIVGAYQFSDGKNESDVDEGQVFVYHGSSTGLSASPAWTADSNQANARFGVSVGTAGDVNRDGYDDVIVGAHWYDNGQTDEGAAFAWYGSGTGLGDPGNPANADWTAESNQADAYFGYSLGSAGDVNLDGYDDVIVGSDWYSNDQDGEGRVFVYHGNSTGLNNNPDWTAESDQVEAHFGRSVSSAGDVNGDGYADVIVGAYYYDNGELDEGQAYVYHGGATGLSVSADWTAESDQAYALFGSSVGSAGDVNGDGYADVIVGANSYTNGQAAEGRVFVYQGGPTGIIVTPDWTAEGDQDFADFGCSVGTAGDVNGDGYAEVIVGASGYDNGQEGEGRAFVYHGSSAGLSTSPNWTAESDQIHASFGYSVGTAGDVNGDGYADVIVGAMVYSNDEFQEGRAFVYLGSSTGLSDSPEWTAEGDQDFSKFGYSVGTTGDVNGDGYADVIIGAPSYGDGQTMEGKAFVYLGSSSGLNASPDWTVEGNQVGANFGRSVGTAGDVNGDGYADVIVGAPSYGSSPEHGSEGWAFVFHGNSTGLSASPDWNAEGNQGGANFGHSVGAAGDVNGDGYADVIVGSTRYDNGQEDEGRAFVFHGGPTGLNGGPGWTAESNQADAGFGNSVSSAGDVNGDGYADVIVGAARYDKGQTDEGQAYLYHGGSTGLSTSPAWTAESDQASANYGVSVGTAGDVNGDGYTDVIVGAYAFDNGEADEGRVFVYHGSSAGLNDGPDWAAESDQVTAYFGVSVGSAGDVNGDGYADVIVGAFAYSNGQDLEGRVFVYHGSSTGLSTNPAWTAESDQALAHFGNAVGTAGDVNGDGYADVIVGADSYDNGEAEEGRAFVYHGGLTGLSTKPDWTAESDQVEAYFGYSLGSAGDVNGDGYADVIVGASLYDHGVPDEGRAYVYYGGSNGLSDSPDWTAESNQAQSYFGQSVGSAGDVNGDGYADVIVGAHVYDNGESNEGAAFAWYGSSSGLGAAGTPLNADWKVESDQDYAFLGWPVGTAGDVNGDGYADVIVGAHWYDNDETNEGRAYLYHGADTGLSSSPDWIAESDQDNAWFGKSLGSAGDVNGDGFADIIIGAEQYTNDQTGEGRAYVNYGNSAGRLVLARQEERDGALIQPWGISDGLDRFQVSMQASDPMGRGRVKLQVQVCPSGETFSSADCLTHTSADWMDVTTSATGILLTETVTGLNANNLFRWRARVLYAPQTVTVTGITPPPNPAHGPWRRFLGQSHEADLRVISDPGSGDARLFLPLVRR